MCVCARGWVHSGEPFLFSCDTVAHAGARCAGAWLVCCVHVEGSVLPCRCVCTILAAAVAAAAAVQRVWRAHPWPLPRQHPQVCTRRPPIPRASLEMCTPLRCVTHARDAVAVRRAVLFLVDVLGWWGALLPCPLCQLGGVVPLAAPRAALLQVLPCMSSGVAQGLVLLALPAFATSTWWIPWVMGTTAQCLR